MSRPPILCLRERSNSEGESERRAVSEGADELAVSYAGKCADHPESAVRRKFIKHIVREGGLEGGREGLKVEGNGAAREGTEWDRERERERAVRVRE